MLRVQCREQRFGGALGHHADQKQVWIHGMHINAGRQNSGFNK